ncbi:MAG: ATP-binding protein, partial [Rudaea sp.]
MSLLRLYILGAPRFEHDGSSIDLPSAKALALLAYLAIAREPQPRERLFALLWGSSTEDAARKNLRNTLWGIGKTLGDHVLRVDEQHLALSSDVWVDAREFERLASTPDRQAAVELYRGDLLANLAISDAPEYEIWLTGERERFAETYLQLLDSLIQDARTRTDWPAVVELARRALGQDNLLEPMYRALMEAHARLGDRTRALQQYEFLKATLRNELDVDPLPETIQLRDAVATGALGPSVPPIGPAPRAARTLRPPASRRIPFVGRQSQRAALDAEWSAAAAGAARIALITGELGIGKSRLWEEWSTPLGDAVLDTRCLEATSSVPYAPLSELFRPRPVLRRLLSPTASISPVWLAELARLLPEIRVERFDLPILAPLPAEEEHRRVLEAFTQCVRALSSPALALFIDDLHWADGATLDWLDYMVHRLADQPILVVATYRPEDAPARLVQMAARWGREGFARRIPVGSLDEEEAAALVSALGASPAGTLQQQSGGNPYFLIELAQAGPGTVPPALADLVRARLERLPGTARQILQAAAVLEPDFDFATLRRTSGRGEEETLDAVDALLDANVLVERDGSFSFAHPLVGQVVRESLSGARRAFLHGRAAKAIERSAVRPEQVAARLADHYAEATDNVRAARYYQAAGQDALALAAPEQALAFYRRALELDPTPERNMGVGEVLLGQGELVQARREFTTALNGFERAGDRRGAARAAMKLAESYFPAGQFADAQQWMEKSFQLFGAEDDSESRALLLLLRGSSELNSGRPGADAELNLRQAAEYAT